MAKMPEGPLKLEKLVATRSRGRNPAPPDSSKIGGRNVPEAVPSEIEMVNGYSARGRDILDAIPIEIAKSQKLGSNPRGVRYDGGNVKLCTRSVVSKNLKSVIGRSNEFERIRSVWNQVFEINLRRAVERNQLNEGKVQACSIPLKHLDSARMTHTNKDI